MCYSVHASGVGESRIRRSQYIVPNVVSANTTICVHLGFHSLIHPMRGLKHFSATTQAYQEKSWSARTVFDFYCKCLRIGE
jgi:hypothetical protein